MFFKKNEKKTALKKEMKWLESYINDLRKRHMCMIRDFMAETNPVCAEARMIIIKTLANDIHDSEMVLNLLKRTYKQM